MKPDKAKKSVKCFIFLHFRLSKTDFHDAVEGDFDNSRDDCQSEGYCDDDKQPICRDDRRSPRRWFLPSPQGSAAFHFNHHIVSVEPNVFPSLQTVFMLNIPTY